MAFFEQAITVLQTLVIALGAGLGIWGVINLLEGYGNDNPGAKSQGMKQLMAGAGVAVVGIVIYGRMIEIYLVTSVAPVPMAAMMGKEWGGMGQNYLRSLLALGFQAFLIIVCVAIYAVLVQNIALEDDIIMAIWSCVGYTVLLCFTLFKTGSLAKSVFQAH